MDGIPSVDWGYFLPRFRWNQGEHVSLIGPTGGGKTTLAREILPLRRNTVVLGTKPKDPTLESMQRDGFRRITKWENRRPHDRQLLLWPTMRQPEDMDRQREVFKDALKRIFVTGGWCIYADELRYLCENLKEPGRTGQRKIQQLLELIWLQGRSLKISLIATAQRPAYVPTLLYDQATHLFFWRDNDELNLKRIGGIGWINSKDIRIAVSSLPMHHVLYVNTRNGTLVTTKVEVLH